MKPSFYALLIVLLVGLIGASFYFKGNKTVTTVAADGSVTEMPLPTGKFIIDDETAAATATADPGTVNGYKNQGAKNQAGNIESSNPDAQMRRRYKNLLVFHADDTMKINKPYIATLILGKDQVFGELKEEVLNASDSKNETYKFDTTLEIGTAMKAKLKDFSGSVEKGFDIDFMGDEGMEQRITDKRKKLMWQWKLTPLTSGEQKLSLSITITEKNGEKVNLPIRSIPIVIYAESTGNQIMGFLQKNYQWLLATLLLPLFLGWYNARLRHKFDQKTFQNRDRQQNERPQTAAINTQPTEAVQNTQGSA
jgi:hypothetical protein